MNGLASPRPEESTPRPPHRVTPCRHYLSEQHPRASEPRIGAPHRESHRQCAERWKPLPAPRSPWEPLNKVSSRSATDSPKVSRSSPTARKPRQPTSRARSESDYQRRRRTRGRRTNRSSCRTGLGPRRRGSPARPGRRRGNGTPAPAAGRVPRRPCGGTSGGARSGPRSGRRAPRGRTPPQCRPYKKASRSDCLAENGDAFPLVGYRPHPLVSTHSSVAPQDGEVEVVSKPTSIVLCVLAIVVVVVVRWTSSSSR